MLLSYDQVLQVLNLPPLEEPEGLRDRAMLEMLYACGMRHGELVALDVTDLDLSAGLVHIREAKNGYQRNVPLTRWARHYISLYLEKSRPHLNSLSSNALWLTEHGRRATRELLPKRLQKVYQSRQVLGFRFTPHLLRHALATHLLRAGASLRNVQEILGHRDLHSTSIYTHLQPLDLQAIHRQFHPRNQSGFPGFSVP